jgi:O-antigen/teichoic acid export membrane protein
LLKSYKIGSPAALIVLMAVVLVTLLQPMLAGVLQGRQDFLWFGWVTILGSLGRFAGVALLITLLGGKAIWAMSGVLVGVTAALGVAFWRTRDIWKISPGEFAWTPFLQKIGPLTVALGATTVIFSQDSLIALKFLTEDESGLYNAAGAVGRALVYLTAVITSVMFPRIAREAALATNSGTLMLSVGATLLMGTVAATASTLLPELPIRLIQGAGYVAAAPLVPWFAWCLLPLTLASTLLNNLLARARYAVILPLVLVATGYWLALRQFHRSPREIIATMGVAATAALLVTAAFSIWESRRSARPQS